MSTELWVSADELSSPNVPQAHQAVMAASFLMWTLSGRKYGGEKRVTEVYECPCRCYSRYWSPTRAVVSPTNSGYYPVLHEGNVYNVAPCSCCGQQHRMRLRGRPIREIEAVEVNGTEMPLESYEIHDDVYLVPTGCGASWNFCSRVKITYTYGASPPEAGRRGAKLLAEQLLLADIDPDKCTLPDRVTSISRQGVTFTVLDPQAFLDQGRLGIYEVDTFLRATNPDRQRRPPRVLSPDMPRGVRVRPARPAAIQPGPYDIVVHRGTDHAAEFTPEQLLANLVDTTYALTGQISSWNGATLAMDDFLGSMEGGGVSITIPAAVTTASLLRDGVYDVYAKTDENTVIHILTGRIITS